jgi:hypothetical protein
MLVHALGIQTASKASQSVGFDEFCFQYLVHQKVMLLRVNKSTEVQAI